MDTDGHYSVACKEISDRALTIVAEFLIDNPPVDPIELQKVLFRDEYGTRSRFQSRDIEGTPASQKSIYSGLVLKIAQIAHSRLNPSSS